jgi:chromosome segregation ATPase
LYQELNKRNTHVNNLNKDLDEIKSKHLSNLLVIEKLEEKVDVLSEPKDSNDVCVNTEEDIEYLSNKKQREIEEFYEQKFQQLNNEISELKLKREQVETKVSELSKNLAANSDENVLLKTENRNFQLEISMNKDKIQMQFIQLNQMTDKVKSLETLNEKLEDEKAQLYEQLHLLLQQNQEILTQTLTSKDLYHEETKAYL